MATNFVAWNNRTFSSHILEARSLKSVSLDWDYSVGRTALPPETGGEDQLWRLPASLGLWLHPSDLCLCLHMAISSVCFSPLETLTRSIFNVHISANSLIETMWTCSLLCLKILLAFTQFQSHFHIFRSMLEEHSASSLLVGNLLKQSSCFVAQSGVYLARSGACHEGTLCSFSTGIFQPNHCLGLHLQCIMSFSIFQNK